MGALEINSSTALRLLQWQLAHADVSAAADYAKFKQDKENELTDKERQRKELSDKLAGQSGADAESTKARIAKLDKAISELQSDLARPLTFEGVLGQEGGAKLISKLTNDPAWLKQLLTSGECAMGGAADAGAMRSLSGFFAGSRSGICTPSMTS